MRLKKIVGMKERSNGVSVIIPAAGEGRRFRESRNGSASSRSKGRTTIDKLYFQIQGRPLIVHALRAFDSVSSVQEIIVALGPGGQTRFRREILSRMKFKKPVVLVRGGATRAESVWQALKRVSKKSAYVCVHDAARPLVQSAWVTHLLQNLNGWDGVVLGRRATATVKVFQSGTGKIKKTLDRNQIFEAETPQIFKKDVLLKAYQALGSRAFHATDDASLVETTGGRMKAGSHSHPNIKVTTYQDLILVRKMIEKTPALRFGLGSDRHRLVSKRPFFLGGVRIHSSVGPLGHSDGDPLLHAITDAILGAVGAGDIGDFFPNTAKQWKNKRSDWFLKKALEIAARSLVRPVQVDATVILERPKLGPRKKKIQAHLAKLLSLPITQIGLKAKTAEGLGPEGEGKAVSCEVLVVLGSSES